MILNSLVKKIVLVSTLLMLSACSFHLQKPLDFPFKNKSLTISPYHPKERFYLSLKQLLNSHGITIKENQAYELHISDMRIDETPAAYGVDGQVHRTRLKVSLQASLSEPHFNQHSNRTILVTRDHTNNPNDALSSTAEKQIIINEMYDVAARRVLYFLTHIPLAENTAAK